MTPRSLQRTLLVWLLAPLLLLVPLVALPRLVKEWPRVIRGGGDAVYVTELISSMVLAVVVGLALNMLRF